MMLSLSKVFAHPELATYPLDLPAYRAALLRPLCTDDVEPLAAFLEGLSPQTRQFSAFLSYDRTTAEALCESINRYDKLRFVVELAPSKTIIGLFEFSFDIPEGDTQRFALYGVPLDASTDCRFGPTLADKYQNQGVGSLVFPHIVDVARRFGQRRIILWGGVFCDNVRAIHYYEKHGFRPAGTFMTEEGQQMLDMILNLNA